MVLYASTVLSEDIGWREIIAGFLYGECLGLLVGIAWLAPRVNLHSGFYI